MKKEAPTTTTYVPAMTIMNLIFSLGRIIKPDFFLLLLVCGGGTKNLEIADGHKGYLFYRNNDTFWNLHEKFLDNTQRFPLTIWVVDMASTLAVQSSNDNNIIVFRNIFLTVSTIYFTFVCIVSFLCCLLKKKIFTAK